MKLTEFFKEHPKVAVAFSGGVDSSYLLYAAKKSGAQVHAYYVKSAFQPQFELDDAKRLAKDISIDMTILPVDILQKDVISNPSNRCYYCKRHIFQTIMQQAHQDGYTVLLDGTNASDDSSDRPGMVALKELSVLSPLRLCGLTKAEIRRRSKEAGLFWPHGYQPDILLLPISWNAPNGQKIIYFHLALLIFVFVYWKIVHDSNFPKNSWNKCCNIENRSFKH